MKFFVPHASDDEQASKVWDSVRAFLLKNGMPTEERKVWKLSSRHNGKAYSEEVGKKAADLRETVLIILRAAKGRPLYYVCTENRGVARGDPYLVGIDQDTHATDFES